MKINNTKLLNSNQVIVEIILYLLLIAGVAAISHELYIRFHLNSFVPLDFAFFNSLLSRVFFIFLLTRAILNFKVVLNLERFTLWLLLVTLLASALHLNAILFKNTLYMVVVFLNILMPVKKINTKVVQKLFLFWVGTYLLITLIFYYTLIIPTGFNFWNADLSYSSIFTHRNAMTVFYIFSLIFASFYWQLKGTLFLALLSTPIIYFSYSRTALLSFAVASGYLLCITASRFRRWKVITLLVLCLLMAVSWKNAKLNPEQISNATDLQDSSTRSFQSSNIRDFQSSSTIRMNLIHKTIALIKKKPLWGYEKFPFFKLADGQMVPPHNILLSNIYSYGGLYMALVLLLAMRIFMHAGHFARAVFIHIFIFSMFQPYFDTLTSTTSVLFLGVTVFSLENIIKRQRPEYS